MKTMELIGQVDEQHQLQVEVPPTIPPGSIKLIVVLPENEEDEFSDAWVQGIAHEWEAELSDPREDIYTMEDGEPIHGRR